MTTTIRPKGAYSLEASTRFLEGFVPAGYRGPAVPGHLHLAFPMVGQDGVAAVCAVQPDGPDGAVEMDAVVEGDGSSSDAIGSLVRILSLDSDGGGYDDIGEQEPAIGRLQARYPGLRPVLFLSPYEAGAWALIGHRISIRQAARVKAAMAAKIGTSIAIHGETLDAFPAPTRLATLDEFSGLFGRKAEYLRGVAEAAMAGQLDADALRALPEDDALERLTTIPGIGPFSAELILLRGVGTTDRAPVSESRLGRAVALAYGIAEPSPARLTEITDAWRPFRTWVTLLVRTYLEDETHEIRDGGTRSPLARAPATTARGTAPVARRRR
jgi:DNA-3-methyladenine glycosylase II